MGEQTYLRAVGKRIKDTRRHLEMTQAEFAEKVGIGISAVFKIETGKVSMKITTLNTICDVLNVDANYILGRAPQSFVAEDSYAYVVTRGYIGNEQE